MIKEGPFITMEAARKAARATADRDNRTQYIVVFKTSYFITDEKPAYEGGSSPFYRLEAIVQPGE